MVLILFLLPEIYNTKLEEKALFQKFGDEWIDYINTISFILPLLRTTKKSEVA